MKIFPDEMYKVTIGFAIFYIIIHMQKQDQPHHFLLFVNSRSGGRKGAQYLTLGQNRLKLKSKTGFYVFVYFYDMFCKTQKQKGLKNLQQLSTASQNVNVIICGGDGTILWVVSEVVKFGINTENVCFGVIPIGTGNDFSRSLGWGGSPINFCAADLRQLRKMIQKWLKASKQKFDLWDVTISTYQNGKITLSSQSVQEQTRQVAELTKPFSNYVGIGIDARVSYHFQKNRTKSKYINLAMYACLGLCCCFRKTQKMHHAIAHFSESESQSQSQNQSEQKDKTLFSPKINDMKLLQKKSSSNYCQVKMKKGYTGLVCLNCTSYMSGVKNIFNTSKIASKNKIEKDFKQSTFNDGKLEFVGFKDQLSLGLERFIHTAGRVTQGQGPFNIKFHEEKEMSQTFVQVDGEAVLVSRLKSIKISKSNITSSGQIRVLVKNRDI